jgi:hypothetical protein
LRLQNPADINHRPTSVNAERDLWQNIGESLSRQPVRPRPTWLTALDEPPISREKLTVPLHHQMTGPASAPGSFLLNTIAFEDPCSCSGVKDKPLRGAFGILDPFRALRASDLGDGTGNGVSAPNRGCKPSKFLISPSSPAWTERGSFSPQTFPETIVFRNVVHRTPRLRLHNQREATRTPIIILGKVA